MLQASSLAWLLDPGTAVNSGDGKYKPKWGSLYDRDREKVKLLLCRLANGVIGPGKAANAQAELVHFIPNGYKESGAVQHLQVHTKQS